MRSNQDRVAGPDVSHGRVHESHARSSGRARRSRELRRREAQAVHGAGPEVRRAECRRRVRGDDRRGLAPGCTLLRTSMRGSAVELSARLKRSDLAGVELDVAGAFGTAPAASSKLIGAFNAENLLSALGALVAQGMPLPAACAALGAAQAGAGPHGSARRPARSAVGRRRLRAHARRAAARARRRSRPPSPASSSAFSAAAAIAIAASGR